MSKNKVGVAVAGLGFVGGQAHVPAFKKILGAELVAVIDVIEKLARDVAAKHNVKYYTDYKQALQDPAIDAIVVAVPTPYHFKIASDSLAAGKHVFCEVPLAPTVAESEQLGKEAEKAGVLFLPDQNFRFTPNYVKVKELIDQGAIGKPLAVFFSEYLPAKDLAAQWPLGSWAWNIEKSGGYPDYTLSVWSIDLVRWLFNSEIEDVQWLSNYAPLEGISNFRGYNTMGILKFASGAIGSFHYSCTIAAGEGTSRLEIYGDNTKALKATWNNYLALTGGPEKQEWTFTEKGTKVWGHYQIDTHFIECILQGKKPIITVMDAVKAQIVASKIVSNPSNPINL